MTLDPKNRDDLLMSRWPQLLMVGVLLGGCDVPMGFELPEPTIYCPEYCENYETACTEYAQTYEADCTTDCLAMPQGEAIESEDTGSNASETDATASADASTPNDAPTEWPTAGNSIACRMHILTLIQNGDPQGPEALCPEANLAGSTLCVDPEEPEPEPEPETDTSTGPAPTFLSCDNVTFEGCCTPDNEVFWCENDTLFTLTCGMGGGSCGWNNEENWYGCRGTGLAEPAGDHPYLCSTESCDNPCQDQACGTHCGQDCGNCGDGLYCTTQNTCEVCSCTDKKCGVNECGQPCGQCTTTDVCIDNQCLPAHGACMNESDIAVYESPVFLDANKTCTAQCMTADDPGTCGTECITEQALFSVECSTCFGAHFGCINLRCKDECVTNPSPVLCSPCIYKQCNVELSVCTGLPIETP